MPSTKLVNLLDTDVEDAAGVRKPLGRIQDNALSLAMTDHEVSSRKPTAKRQRRSTKSALISKIDVLMVQGQRQVSKSAPPARTTIRDDPVFQCQQLQVSTVTPSDPKILPSTDL